MRFRPLRLLLAGLLLALGAAACTTRTAPPGPGPTEPRLELERLTERRAAATVVMPDGLELPLRAWLPEAVEAGGEPKAVLLALHGFNDHSGAFGSAAPALQQRGIAVYAYDQRGFGAAANPGLWAGGERLALDARTALELLSRQHPGRPLYLLGESMGGAVALRAASLDPAPPLHGVILSAPAVWADELQPWYQRWALRLAVRLVPGLRPSGRGHAIQASDNIEALNALGRDPLVIKYSRIDTIQGLVELMGEALESAPQVEVPVLLLRGEHDRLIPQKPVELLWQRLPKRPGTQLLFYPDGWHLLLRDLQAEVVLNDIAFWIDHPQVTPPSVMAGLASSEFEKAD